MTHTPPVKIIKFCVHLCELIRAHSLDSHYFWVSLSSPIELYVFFNIDTSNHIACALVKQNSDTLLIVASRFSPRRLQVAEFALKFKSSVKHVEHLRGILTWVVDYPLAHFLNLIFGGCLVIEAITEQP